MIAPEIIMPEKAEVATLDQPVDQHQDGFEMNLADHHSMFADSQSAPTNSGDLPEQSLSNDIHHVVGGHCEAIKPLVSIAMDFVPIHLETDDKFNVSSAIEQFLMGQLLYEEACRVVHGLVGTSEPIDQLNTILQIPLPGEVQDKFNLKPKKGTWTLDEDQRLLAGIYYFGTSNWLQISEFMGNGRSIHSCSWRWYKSFNPKISNEPWTKEEEDRLITLMSTPNITWSKISREFANKTTVQCRQRFQQIQQSYLESESKKTTLVDIGLSFVMNYLEFTEMNGNELLPVSETIQQFVAGIISYEQAMTEMERLIGTTEPLEQLMYILQIPPEPIVSLQSESVDSSPNRSEWSHSEEQHLLAGVYNFGTGNWDKIAEFVGNGRAMSTCRHRWNNILDPKISEMKWSKEEDDELVKLVWITGDRNAWGWIALQIPGHNKYQCRYRYHQIMSERLDIQTKIKESI
jgi:hypothetical protein